MNHYPSNLTDSRWMLLIGNLKDKRKRNHSLRDIFNAIFYLLKTGCQWRMLPKCFPKWELVYYYFTKWKNTGVIEQIHEFLRDYTRKKAGRNVSPSFVCTDSQSIKNTHLGGQDLGNDGGKHINGRKRHIITDTIGLLLTVVVHAPNIHDSEGAPNVIVKLKGRFNHLLKIVADGGNRGELADKTIAAFGNLLDLVLRPKEPTKFEVIPQRWVVKRTFSWFESYRRLCKDFEYLTDTSETIIQIAMIKLTLKKNQITKFKTFTLTKKRFQSQR